MSETGRLRGVGGRNGSVYHISLVSTFFVFREGYALLARHESISSCILATAYPNRGGALASGL